uniref:Heat shock protein 70 n=1 Tax=Panagrolaimus davidi TaxID=227884 RepID=A0A914PRD5_9BILA
MHTKCGQVVIDRLRNYASSTIFDSKRLIGKTTTVIDKTWPFKVITDDDKIYIKLDTPHGEIRQTATEVAAVLLKYIKIKAEEFQGKKLDKVVLTVPAAFSLAQEEATREAAILAGWKTVMLLPEPIAASFAYFIDRPIPNNSLLLLFDLGGGTLDVCVFKIANSQIEIISKNGDSKLGGRDFDNLLMDYFLNLLNLDFNISKLGNKKYKLLLECQKIKHNLSVRDLDQLDVEDIDPSKDGEINITRQNFQNLAEDLLIRIKNTIFSALYNSGYKLSQIDKVLQVGGGCRVPMIKQLLQEIFPEAEHCCEEHPDEVVAIGAAYYAYNIFTDD